MRYYIVGTSGSGKSTLARSLSEKWGLPCLDLDNLYFLPHWTPRAEHDFIAQVDRATKTEKWVACGNYSLVQNMLFDRADTIVWLDYPFWKIFWQVINRTFQRLFTKEACCNGNYESFHRHFLTKDSIFLWVIKTYSKRKKKYTRLMQQNMNQAKWVRITNSQDLTNFLSASTL